MNVVRATTPTGRARALEDPITRFVMEPQSCCHLRSHNWTEGDCSAPISGLTNHGDSRSYGYIHGEH
jgi:hypothetical protein